MRSIKGRTIQRERRIYHGDYLTVRVFPVFQKSGKRSRQCRPSSEIQKKLNQKYREEKITYLMNENFSQGDLEVGLGYSDEYLPQDYSGVQKDVRNFVRRLKRYRDNNELEELKYLYVIEKGERRGRWHVHFATNGDIDRDVIENLWGKGYAHSFRMEFDDEGLKGLSKYKVKEPETSAAVEEGGKVHRWGASKNLKKPRIPKDRDNFISRKTVAEIREGSVTEKEIERLYPGYVITEWSPYKNNINAGEYLTIQLRKMQISRTGKEVLGKCQNNTKRRSKARL